MFSWSWTIIGGIKNPRATPIWKQSPQLQKQHHLTINVSYMPDCQRPRWSKLKRLDLDRTKQRLHLATLPKWKPGPSKTLSGRWESRKIGQERHPWRWSKQPVSSRRNPIWRWTASPWYIISEAFVTFLIGCDVNANHHFIHDPRSWNNERDVDHHK